MNTNTNPFLSGNFAPVQDELISPNLKVIGEIPQDLLGIYMRNGPNPAFTPISYTYPFDGDGMIHAIYLENGKAEYRNRFVETKGYLKEKKAGKALYGGILNPIPMDPQYAGPEDEPIAIKNGTFIHIIRHAGNYLALNEGSAAYQMNSDLETLGEWKPAGMDKPIEVCAHTRIDPQTGDLWFVNYALMPPFLSVYRFNKQGALVQKQDLEKDHSSMIHDFALTENYVIIFDCPATFDLQKLMSGGSVLNWQPELGTRIGLLSRRDGKMQWLPTEPFFVFHFANAYETDKEIIVDYVRHDDLNLANMNKAQDKPPTLYRTLINKLSFKIKHQALDDRMIEFPRIREDRDSLSHQFIYTPTRTSQIQNKRAFNALVKYDVNSQQTKVHEFGDFAEIGEAVFAPSQNSQREDEGYIMLFVYNSQTAESEFIILDASQFENEALARIQLPRRIPAGLHGSWMPGAWK